MSLTAGTCLGAYRILGPLGEGGMRQFDAPSSSSFRCLAVRIALATCAGTIASSVCAQNSATLEEIIVEARRSSENLQNVPIAVSVLTAQDLTNRGLLETSDLNGSSPNLQVTSAYAQTQPSFTIRGVGVTNEFSSSTSAAVGVYVDDVYQTFRASHGQRLYDLRQIEILRGPQGTLFGKNTTGGAVLIETRRPSLQGRDGFLRVGLSNLSGYDLEGAYEETIDNVGLRLAGIARRADGYTHNPVDGLDYGEQDSRALRLSVRWDASNALQGQFQVRYADNDARGDLAYGIGYLDGGRSILALDPVTGAVNPQVPGVREGLAQDEVASDSGNRHATRSSGAAMTWRYRVGNLELESVTGYDKGRVHLSPQDCDGSAVEVCAAQIRSESESFSQDLRVHFGADSFRLIAGAWFADEEVESANGIFGYGFLDDIYAQIGIPDSFFNPPIFSDDALGIVPDGTPQCQPVIVNPNGFNDARALLDPANCQGIAPPLSPVHADQRFTVSRPTRALYGEAGLDLGEKFTLTLGYRYTWDDIDYVDARTVLFSRDGVARASTVPYSYPYDATLPPVRRNEDSHEGSGRIVLDAQISDNAMAWVGFSRGYRTGGYNGLAYQDIDQIYYVEPEIVDAYEAGFKSRLAGDRVRLNGAVFSYDYTNQQIAEIVGVTSFLRAADGDLWGAELELTAAVTDRLTVTSGLGFLRSEYDDNQVLYGGGAQLDIGGNEFANAPGETFSAAIDWQIGRFAGGELALSVNAQYMGEYFFDAFGDYGGRYVGGPESSDLPLASRELGGGNPAYW
ncbi:MAG TPA: TonB-dependent receptor, partial [Gammaproteobacteria bacterium]|nr:TonB-dependent receptor [Gammaproteobacteria bacterium]